VAIQDGLARIAELNSALTRIEVDFSSVLGHGSRWMERVVIGLLFLAVLMVEAVGLTLTFVTTRALSRGLAKTTEAAARIGAGDFSVSLPIRSRDELGLLAQSVNQMRDLLERSYRDLEARVAARTSELEAMAKENARLYEQANAAVKMRDEFFSIASHELKTPLTGLNLHLQLLLRQVSDSAKPVEPAKILQQLESCLRQSRRLALLSEELMDLTRIRLGKFEIKPASCDLTAVVRDVALLLGAEAARADTPMEIHAPAPVQGSFDATRIGQVVTNLISNAIKYGRAKPIEVQVSRQGSLALIEVRDQGVGIPPEHLDRVFDRFERVDEAHAKASGLGLGLYIARQIVEKHGGKISVQSTLGSGSVFRCELPLNPGELPLNG
jgi:signal transduction histidine kinase